MPTECALPVAGCYVARSLRRFPNAQDHRRRDFPGFELLDLFGPLEMFGMLEDAPDIRMVAETMDPVVSRQGPASVVDATFAEGCRVRPALGAGRTGHQAGY
jgi:hypothetical protein